MQQWLNLGFVLSSGARDAAVAIFRVCVMFRGNGCSSGMSRRPSSEHHQSPPKNPQETLKKP